MPNPPKQTKTVKRKSNGKLEGLGFEFCLNRDQLVCWLKTVIENTYITIGKDIVLHQSKGLPMGIPPAVWMAQIFCFMAEIRFMRRLLRAQRFDIIDSFRFTSRYVDDILALANEFIKHLLSEDDTFEGLRGIYPNFLIVKAEQESTEAVDHLDLHIHKYGPSPALLCSIYDKKLAPPLDKIKHISYPHVESYICNTAKYGVVSSQLVRYARLCTRKEFFIQNARSLLTTLLSKKYERAKLVRTTTAFINKHPYLYACRSTAGLTAAIINGL